MTSEPPETGRGITKLNPAIGETIIGIGVLALAGIVYWQTISIPVSPIYAKVGPAIVPYITAVCLGALGILLLAAALRGGWQPAEEKEVMPDRVALVWVAAGLVLNVLLIAPAGFTLASVLLFVCIARGFGSKAILRDAAIGAAFTLIAYFGFAKTLGINIGSGLIEAPIDSAIQFVLERVFGIEG
jgi:Tripartite tricarboxylate transporter TctB family